MPTEKTQAEWDTLAKKIGTYVRIWHYHTTSITRAKGFDDIAKAIGTNFTDDNNARDRQQELQSFVGSDIRRAESRQTAIQSQFRRLVLNDIRDFLKSSRNTVLVNDFDDFGRNDNRGVLKDFQQAMKNNVPTEQFFLENTVSYSTPTSNACNVVIGTTGAIITNISLTEMADTQRVNIICDDETKGEEEFLVEGEDLGAESVSAQIGTDYSGYFNGVSFRIDRPQEENNDTNDQLGFLDTNRGEDTSNTDNVSTSQALRLHFVIWNNHSGNNEVRAYSASSGELHTNQATNLVMFATRQVGTGTMQLAETNSSGISADLTIATSTSFTAQTNIYYDLKLFFENDEFSIDTTRDTIGRFQSFFTEIGIPMNTGTSSQVTLPDDFAAG